MRTIDAGLLQRAFLGAAKNLEAEKEWINELNVFPVPDGDTGTNMTMTMQSAAREVSGIETPTVEALAKAIASGSLRGARGNSGVILSQLLRGFTREIADAGQIDVPVLSRAFVRATETAYKAVMKPKEGTILTVAKGMSDKAAEIALQTEDILEFADLVTEHGDYVLSQTPEMLPVLKQAGVVDAGGEGLIQVLKGAREVLRGRTERAETQADMKPEDALGGEGNAVETGTGMAGGSAAGAAPLEEAEIRFGYCTEFIINLEQSYGPQEEQELKSYLSSIGDCLVVVSDDEIVKVHVHTNAPGLAIQKGLSYGSLTSMKIDNMREEHHERVIRNAGKPAAGQNEAETAVAAADASLSQAAEPERTSAETTKSCAFLAVTAGKGLGEIFRGLGADGLIEGGQTMNPSTEDILNAAERVEADTVYVLPNNKNIILAAEQAKYLIEDKQIVVVPSKTVPQGITALIHFLPDQTPEENLQTMTGEMERVKTAEITYAVRDTKLDGTEIHKGDIMGIGDAGLLAVGTGIAATAEASLRAMVDEESELVTVYYGCDTKREDAETLCGRLAEEYPDLEIELQDGGQPVYYYLISVE